MCAVQGDWTAVMWCRILSASQQVRDAKREIVVSSASSKSEDWGGKNVEWGVKCSCVTGFWCVWCWGPMLQVCDQISEVWCRGSGFEKLWLTLKGHQKESGRKYLRLLVFAILVSVGLLSVVIVVVLVALVVEQSGSGYGNFVVVIVVTLVPVVAFLPWRSYK